jgi:hypothetical protein
MEGVLLKVDKMGRKLCFLAESDRGFFVGFFKAQAGLLLAVVT